jgi:hypothetical protein
MREFEEYIQLRKEGLFGFDDEEREKKKLLTQMVSKLPSQKLNF